MRRFYFSGSYAPVLLAEMGRLQARVENDAALRADEQLRALTDPEFDRLITEHADRGAAVVVVMDAEMFDLLAPELDPQCVRVA